MVLRGKFIAIDGIDGSGKTTLIKSLTEIEGKIVASFPLLDIKGEDKGLWESFKDGGYNKTGMPLLMASAYWNKQHMIMDMLESFDIVIMDRSTMSNINYCIGSRIWTRDRISALYSGALKPNNIIYVHIPFSEYLRRRDLRDKSEINFYEWDDAYMRKVWEGYLSCTMELCNNWKVLDGMQSKEDLRDTVANLFNNNS